VGDFATWVNGLHFGAVNTLLLIVVVMIIRSKVVEHNEVYLWYLVKRAQEKEKE
jgi:hypothetical protein